MNGKLIFILFVKLNVETDQMFNFDQLDDEFEWVMKEFED